MCRKNVPDSIVWFHFTTTHRWSAYPPLHSLCKNASYIKFFSWCWDLRGKLLFEKLKKKINIGVPIFRNLLRRFQRILFWIKINYISIALFSWKKYNFIIMLIKKINHRRATIKNFMSNFFYIHKRKVLQWRKCWTFL